MVYEQNVAGPTGVGKTHLACALGVWACTNGYRTAFFTAADLLMSLISAKRADRLKQRLTTIERYDLVIIDELGYLPFEREATDLLFQVIAGRYERGSVAITTNLAFPDWGHVFPDAMAASAVRSDRASCGRFRAVGPELPTTFSSEGIGEEK